MGTLSFIKTKERTVIDIPQNLTTSIGIEGVRLSLLNALGQFKVITLRSKGPVNIGFSFLELLQSTKLKAESQNKLLFLDIELTEGSKELVKLCECFELLG